MGFFNVLDMNAIQEMGVGYKHVMKHGALRLASGFGLNTQVRESDDIHYDYSTHSISPRIGYEFHQSFNRLRLYYGVDVVTSFYKSKNKQIYLFVDPNEVYINTRKINQAGLRPILGLTVFLSKSISLSTETYLNVMYYKTITEQDTQGDVLTETSKGMDVGLGPLGIVSVNFHF
jgi:hypothetical protein